MSEMSSSSTATQPPLLNFAIKLHYKEEGQEVIDTFRVQAPSSALALAKIIKRRENDLPKEIKIKIKQI
jgi:hypothetical protein